MAARMHPDFHLLVPDALREPLGWSGQAEEGAEGDAEGKGARAKAKPSKEIRVDAVRAAIDWGQKTSSRGGAKVILIHPAQAMNPISRQRPAEDARGTGRPHCAWCSPPTIPRPCCRPCAAAASACASTCRRPRRHLHWLAAQQVARPAVLLAAAGGQPLDAAAHGRRRHRQRRLAAIAGGRAGGQAAAVADWPLTRLVDALQKLCHDLMCLRAQAAPRYFTPATLDRLMQPEGPSLGGAGRLVGRAGAGRPSRRTPLARRPAHRGAGRTGRPVVANATQAGARAAQCIGYTRRSMSEAAARTTQANAPANASSRPSVIQLVFREKGALYAAYIPLFADGGLFVPTTRDYRLGEDIYLLLSLPDDPQRYPVAGKVGWITPANASGGRTQGVGVRFPSDEKTRLLKLRIEEMLGTSIQSAKPTQTI